MLNCYKRLLFGPWEKSSWASKMVLNPAMIQDPKNPQTIHMLFRATGPCPNKQLQGKPLPFPISLGYAVSHDQGQSWLIDFDKPALAPDLKYEADEIYLPDGRVNYANGCIEDPRLFYFEEQLYLSAACRVFPPGPYWEKDDPKQCMPDWIFSRSGNLKRAVKENYTVSVLYKVNLNELASQNYDSAFEYQCPLHNPDAGDNRDVFLFPERINGKIICLHRPKNPQEYKEGKELDKPSIFIAAADSIEQLSGDKAIQKVLAIPCFKWESNRIGASWPPLKLDSSNWLLPYHGKQDDYVGYTQSFMILRESGNNILEVIQRSPERMMYADKEWEQGTDFPTPCLFTCSGVLLNNGKLLMGYGAADQKVCIAETDLSSLLETIGYSKKTADIPGSNDLA
ncbi:MAG: hypothetical protein JXR78_09565 [Victivallales bacterium]|nr:hypothetical protein [Victivallales bacterium]